jgi:hypothetical protein
MVGPIIIKRCNHPFRGQKRLPLFTRKFQISNNIKYQNSNDKNKRVLNFLNYDLEFVCNLVLVIWDFRSIQIQIFHSVIRLFMQGKYNFRKR